MKQVSDAEIARTFKVSTDTIHRWKNDTVKYKYRYEMYKMFATLVKNGIGMYDVLSMSEKIIKLEADIKELEDAVNDYVDKEEKLRGLTR